MSNYVDASGGDEYFASRVGSDAWDDSEPSDKEKALGHATKIIDRLNYAGTPATADNAFPRTGYEDVPTEIKDACCEIALALLDGINPELELENLMQVQSGYANLKTTFDRSQLPEHILAGVPSSTAWRLLKPWIVDSRSLKLTRVG